MRFRFNTQTSITSAALALLALYVATIPGNHTETEDSYDYAYKVRTASVGDLVYPHHLAYLPAAKALYSTGIFSDPFTMMVGGNVLLGVGGVLATWRVARERFALSPPAAGFVALFLAFSYGYWRYSVAAEVYIPAVLMQALLCLMAFAASTSAAHAVLCGFVAAAAIATHGPLSAPLAIAAVPAYFALTRRFRTLLIYGLVATVSVCAVYYIGWQLLATTDGELGQFITFIKGPPEEPRAFSLATLMKALIGFGTVFISSNPLFAIPSLVERVQSLMPYRNLTEELFMAKNFNRVIAAIALVLAASLGAMAVYVLTQLRCSGETWRRLRGDAKIVALSVWFTAYAILVIVIHPDSPELWICFLLPVALATGVVLNSCYRHRSFRTPLAFCAVLLLCNLSGMAMIRPQASDYHRHRAAWVLSELRPGDGVYTRDADVFTRYLRYHAPPDVTVVNCWGSDAAATTALLTTAEAAPARRFVFDDVFSPPPYLTAGRQEAFARLGDLRAELAPRLRPTGDPHVLLLLP